MNDPLINFISLNNSLYLGFCYVGTVRIEVKEKLS